MCSEGSQQPVLPEARQQAENSIIWCIPLDEDVHHLMAWNLLLVAVLQYSRYSYDLLFSCLRATLWSIINDAASNQASKADLDLKWQDLQHPSYLG